MYKTILTPLDGSELSECTLSHVKAIATGCHVPEVVLLRVIEPIHRVPEVGDDFIRNAREGALENAKSYLSQVAENLKKEGINASIAVLEGQAADKILGYIQENKIDLVVMGTHGMSGVTRWLMGSVADKVVRHSKAPVLTVTPAGCRA
jgi:nucleotide-binding universal stress UspA family protein